MKKLEIEAQTQKIEILKKTTVMPNEIHDVESAGNAFSKSLKAVLKLEKKDFEDMIVLDETIIEDMTKHIEEVKCKAAVDGRGVKTNSKCLIEDNNEIFAQRMSNCKPELGPESEDCLPWVDFHFENLVEISHIKFIYPEPLKGNQRNVSAHGDPF